MFFEQGPIRPPSESQSLLVRVTRNCPWNRCTFCPVYKNERFSLREVGDVLADIDAMRSAYHHEPETAFLQDADPLTAKTEDIIAIVEKIREEFPKIGRITAYARAFTLTRKQLSELKRLKTAGLDRLHIGLESGAQVVLDMVRKGATREQQIEAGLRAREAGFELSEYIMPGLGGREYSDVHADDTASALLRIEPDFVRLRTTAYVPGTPLAAMRDSGSLIPLSESEVVTEIRRLLSGIDDLKTRLESDHILNLLSELRGNLPEDRPRLLDICDQFLQLSDREKLVYIVGRRSGIIRRLAHLDRDHVKNEIEAALDRLGRDGIDPATISETLKSQMV